MKQIKTEIIAVGTELLLGQIANTNAQWMSEKMAMNGINVFHHSVVGDNLRRVIDQFQYAERRADVVIVTGGLGPTEDDLTKKAFQHISNLGMIEHGPSMKRIEAYFYKQGTEMTSNNRKQAHVFTEADVIENNVGMAPGMIVSRQGTTWIFLPGVPTEMKQMMVDNVIPYLKEITGQTMVIKSTMLQFIGIGEARLEHELSDVIKNQDNPTIAPLAQTEGVSVRVTANAPTHEEASELIGQTKKQILTKVGDYFYGTDGQSLVDSVCSLLKGQHKYIGIAESLTGGMFIEKLISVEGASQVCRGGLVCYDTSVKKNVLRVSSKTIQQYGTISEQCAQEMAEKACTLLDSDIGISFTGVAGPDSVEGHPAGTVYIGIHDVRGHSKAQKFMFQGDRQAIRNKASLKGTELLYNLLKNEK